MPGDAIPYVVKIFYTVSTFQHVSKVGIAPVGIPDLGQDFTTIQIVSEGGGFAFLDAFVDGLVGVMRPLYGTADDIERAELWYNSPDGFSSSFLSAYDISLAGSGAAGNPTAQVIYTFRSHGGHIAKFYLMEPNVSSNALLRPPYPAGTLLDLADYLASSNPYMLARDNSYVYASLGIAMGQNEKLWRKRYRP